MRPTHQPGDPAPRPGQAPGHTEPRTPHGPPAEPSATSDLRDAARAYWRRRGLPTTRDQVVVAPSAPLLLLALLGTVGGEVVLPRPSAAWYAPQADLLGRARHPVPVPPECGGVPDPFTLLETVRRARGEGGDPRVLLLSVADETTGTAPPPELVREVCEAAAAAGLLIVSDETWRDTFHRPHDTMVVSPAEMLPEPASVPVVVLLGLGGVDPTLTAAVARLPAGTTGAELAAATRGVLAGLHAAPSPATAAAAAHVLREPPEARRRRADQARAHGAMANALCRAVAVAGGLCRPPHAGRHLYVDLEPRRAALAARGVTSAPGLEAALVSQIGPYAHGGHRFGEDPRELRVRLDTALLADSTAPHHAPAGEDPLRRPGPRDRLRTLHATLRALTGASDGQGAGTPPDRRADAGTEPAPP